MSAVQLPFAEPSKKAAAVQQGPYRAESTFHANWVSESGEHMCSSCYVLGAAHVVGGRVVCSFCFEHQGRMKR